MVVRPPTWTSTLSLHDALPISFHLSDRGWIRPGMRADLVLVEGDPTTNILATRNIVAVWKRDRKSTRLNSSHAEISYAVFCLKKKVQSMAIRQPIGPGSNPW